MAVSRYFKPAQSWTPEGVDSDVLVLAPIGRDATTVVDVLRKAEIAAEACATIGALLAGLEAGARAAFIAEEGLFADDANKLFEWVRDQPTWSDFPFVLLTSRHDQPQVTRWREQKMRQLGNVSLLERPVQPITLVSLVQAALRARSRQHEVRELLEEQRQAATRLESLIDQRTLQLQEANAHLRAEIDERARIEDALRHAQKMDALGQLTGGVAHDFNNLLMVITAGIDMLDRQTDPARRERIYEGMKQAAQRGASLTRQLLSFARNHALKPEVVDVRSLITQMSDLLHRSLRGDIQVELDIEPGVWPIYVDPGELEIAILNLCVNARDAMQRGGTITIRASNCDDGNASEGRSSVNLTVADAGTGMTPDVKARVFDPFFTTKDVGKGSGLGLAQVYGFARQSGGSVDIESELGVGTSVTLHLPRAGHAQTLPSASPDSRVGGIDARGGSILLVEDDQEVAAMVLDMLDTLGFDVVHATSGVSALGALSDKSPFDLVLSDIMMPGGMNGISLAREIREAHPDMPIVLCSGYSDAFGEDARALGITVLPKPYHIQELQAAIQLAFAANGVHPS